VKKKKGPAIHYSSERKVHKSDIKGRLCADGRHQQATMTKEETTSPIEMYMKNMM